jgi:hypothetical protein
VVRSIEQTIFATVRSGQVPPGLTAMLGGEENARRFTHTAATLAHEVMIPRSFEGNIDDRDHVISSYERHNEEVRRDVPSSRLLDYDVSQGWGPLCAFLGAPVPDIPFPHANDRGSLLADDKR